MITLAGIEKVLPRFADLEVMLQMLARSATGERMSPYTSLWTGVTPDDGPQKFHVVLLDNGRSAILGRKRERQTLRCIRCAACMNACPVYRQTGGHAYGSVYPGPIGAILTPQLQQLKHAQSLPYASSLCGACYEVCPVKINIPEILIDLRARHVDEARGNHRLPRSEAIAMSAAAWVRWPSPAGSRPRSGRAASGGCLAAAAAASASCRRRFRPGPGPATCLSRPSRPSAPVVGADVHEKPS